MNRQELNFFKNNGFYKFPSIVQIEVTKSCPLRCTQCYKEENNNVDIDYNELLRFLDFLDGKCSAISLNGGEPLVYPNITSLLKKVSEMQYSTYLYTSGFGIDSDICNIVKGTNKILFYISLNGSTKKINNLSRDGYEYAVEAMELLSTNKVNYGINWVARHDNVDDFDNVIKVAKQFNASHISVVDNRLTGAGNIDSPMLKEDISTLADKINNNNKKTPVIMIVACFSRINPFLSMKNKGVCVGCTAGINRCVVNCDFSYQPCTHLNYIEKFSSLEEYWNNSLVLQELRQHKFKNGGLCEKCKHATLCNPCMASDVELYNKTKKYLDHCILYESAIV